MKTQINIYFGLIILLTFLASCGGKKEKETKELIKPVKFQEVSYAHGGTNRTFLGTARSNKEINLSFRSSGILTTLNIAIGQKVNKGDLLAQLDNTEAILSLEQANASLNSAKSSLNTATSALNRTRTLFEKGSASLSDYESAKSRFVDAQANYQSALRSVEIRKKQVAYGTIYAPSNGIIASRKVEINENVNAGEVVANLNAGSFMEIRLGIPENAINRVAKGMQVVINFPSLENSVFNGMVSEVSPSIDANTSTYPVRIKIENATKEIKSGMAANVVFTFDNLLQDEELIVPITAVGEDSKGNFVFIIISTDGKTGTVQKKHFAIKELTNSGFIVKDGLKIGEKVATAGLQTLLDGQKVRLN
ncbi:efflux RND transporter periplasmic adaptor subunit [Prolixibacteraceae bacterium JC049]|nr:efflux RND transporter periplasmic adaptor subunit [Prolixibacteraceae bacterium JC049]